MRDFEVGDAVIKIISMDQFCYGVVSGFVMIDEEEYVCFEALNEEIGAQEPSKLWKLMSKGVLREALQNVVAGPSLFYDGIGPRPLTEEEIGKAINNVENQIRSIKQDMSKRKEG